MPFLLAEVACLQVQAADIHLVPVVGNHQARAADNRPAQAADSHRVVGLAGTDPADIDLGDIDPAGIALAGIGPADIAPVDIGSVRFAVDFARPSRNRSRARGCKARRTW